MPWAWKEGMELIDPIVTHTEEAPSAAKMPQPNQEIRDEKEGIALVDFYDLHRRKSTSGFLGAVAERKGRVHMVSLDDNRHPRGCTCGSKNPRYLCKHLKFMERPEVRLKARFTNRGNILPEQPRTKTPPENLRVVSTKTLWRRTEIVGYVCALIDDDTDEAHFVSFDWQRAQEGCSCQRDYEKRTGPCVHLRWITQLPGFSYDAFEREPKIVQPDIPAPIAKIHIAGHEDRFFNAASQDWTNEEEVSKLKYRYCLEFKTALSREGKASVATLKRAFKDYNKQSHLYLREISVQADSVTMRLDPLLKFQSWMSFSDPLEILLSQARKEYAAKQHEEQKKREQRRRERAAYRHVAEALLLFQLDEDATLEDVKVRYYQLGLQYHPDMGGNDPIFFRYVHSAYQILCDWFGSEVSA